MCEFSKYDFAYRTELEFIYWPHKFVVSVLFTPHVHKNVLVFLNVNLYLVQNREQ